MTGSPSGQDLGDARTDHPHVVGRVCKRAGKQPGAFGGGRVLAHLTSLELNLALNALVRTFVLKGDASSACSSFQLIHYKGRTRVPFPESGTSNRR
jgi:hypothetical protein